MWKLVLVAVVASAALAAPVPKELRAVKDADRIVGTWEVVRSNRNGQESATYSPAHALTFRAGGELVFTYPDDDKPQFAAWTIDPAAKPKALSWRMGGGGALSARTYAFTPAGHLVIARSDDRAPPASAEPGTGITVIEYKRAEKK